MTINPNNYTGANITVVGKAGGAYQVREFDNGGSQAQLSIAVDNGYKNRDTGEWVKTGTDWYTLTASTQYAEENWPEIAAGDTVRVDDARLEFRAYTDKAGEPRVQATLRFGTLVVVERKADRDSGSSGGGFGSEDTPF